MNRIKGLKEYVKTEKYRKALRLPQIQTESYELLAQGEYNMNYSFVHPLTGQKLLLRVNCGSQMHLEHQIEYEYYAMGLLESSGRTPKAVYVDGSKEKLDHGVMVMEYLSGHVLDYHTELKQAAECLADIHSVKISEDNKLLSPGNPLETILDECEEMFRVYAESPMGDDEKKDYIRKMLDKGRAKVAAMKSEAEQEGPDGRDSEYLCCINTELNSTNFLINGEGRDNYLIDWEKPLLGDPAQDLGHFLAPTTTFWKTDVILTAEEMDQFLDHYIKSTDHRFPTEGLKERTYTFIPITCLRGITWCAMAWVQYQKPDKLIFNESTFRKLEAYLDAGFLKKINQLLDA